SEAVQVVGGHQLLVRAHARCPGLRPLGSLRTPLSGPGAELHAHGAGQSHELEQLSPGPDDRTLGAAARAAESPLQPGGEQGMERSSDVDRRGADPGSGSGSGGAEAPAEASVRQLLAQRPDAGTSGAGEGAGPSALALLDDVQLPVQDPERAG